MTPKTPNTPMSDSDLDNFIDSFWDELDKELQEATQDDQDDPSVWEQKWCLKLTKKQSP